MKKRILSILLTLALALSLLLTSALAAENSFGVSMGGTQLEAGKYYRTNDDGTVEETAAENYEIYFIADDTNVYTLTINDAAEHEITFGSGTTLTVVDYTTTPDGNRATHVARDGGAVMIQSRDGDVTGEPENASSLPTFIVMTFGKTDITLAPGQTLTVAYPKEDGGYTNACPIQAAETNTADVALFLRGDRGYNNSVILNPGVAVTMDGILYEFTNDVDNRALTMDFHMNLDSPTSDIHYAIGSLKISAPRAYTDIFNGYGFAEGCTEAEFTFSTDSDGYSVISLTGGAIALDEWESVTVNGVTVEGAGSTVITMDEVTGKATVDGSAIIDGVLETRGNPGDNDYRALVEIAADSTVILQEGDAESLETTYFSLANGGTVTVSPETSITYSASGNYLELEEGIITVDSIEDSVIVSRTDYSDGVSTTVNIELFTQDTPYYTLESSWDSVILSDLSGDVNVVMDEGSELLYDTDDGTKVIKAQSHADNVTIREDGSIWMGETVVEPNQDGHYVVGAAHQTFILGGFTLYGNPDGISYDEENGILSVNTRGQYEISNTNPGTTTDVIEVSAGGSITLKGVRIEATEGNALTITSDSVTLCIEGANSLTGGEEASGLTHYNSDPLSICGSGTLTVTGNDYPAIDGSISVDSTTVIATGASGIAGNVTVDGGTVTATGTTHAGIDGDVNVYSAGSVTATGGSSDDGAPGIDGAVSVESGSVTAAGGSAVASSNGNGGAGSTGSVYVYSGTASFTGGNGSGSGHGGMGMDGDDGWHTSWIGVGGSITAAGGVGSGGTAQASALTISSNNAMLEPSEENTAFTLTAEENSVRLSNIGGSAQIFMYHDESYENGGSLIVQDASGNKQTITVNDAQSSANLSVGSTGSISGETDNVTITVISTPPSVTVRYKVITETKNGTIDVDAYYKRGETVAFTITPDAGYVLETVTVTRKSGAEVAVTESDGIYTFEMPDSRVTVNAEFVLAFEDIERDHQFYKAIEWVYQQKLMIGVTETSFDRVSPVTRQQVWRVLARLISNEDPGSMAAAKEWAVANGIADGTAPGAAATREEFVTMMWLALGKPAADASVLAQFSDADTISTDASAAMAWAVSAGIVEGYEDDTLRPTATASRGAFAAILYRYYTK